MKKKPEPTVSTDKKTKYIVSFTVTRKGTMEVKNVADLHDAIERVRMTASESSGEEVTVNSVDVIETETVTKTKSITDIPAL